MSIFKILGVGLIFVFFTAYAQQAVTTTMNVAAQINLNGYTTIMAGNSTPSINNNNGLTSVSFPAGAENPPVDFMVYDINGNEVAETSCQVSVDSSGNITDLSCDTSMGTSQVSFSNGTATVTCSTASCS